MAPYIYGALAGLLLISTVTNQSTHQFVDTLVLWFQSQKQQSRLQIDRPSHPDFLHFLTTRRLASRWRAGHWTEFCLAKTRPLAEPTVVQIRHPKYQQPASFWIRARNWTETCFWCQVLGRVQGLSFGERSFFSWNLFAKRVKKWTKFETGLVREGVYGAGSNPTSNSQYNIT